MNTPRTTAAPAPCSREPLGHQPIKQSARTLDVDQRRKHAGDDQQCAKCAQRLRCVRRRRDPQQNSAEQHANGSGGVKNVRTEQGSSELKDDHRSGDEHEANDSDQQSQSQCEEFYFASLRRLNDCHDPGDIVGHAGVKPRKHSQCPS